jgi:hypothetical protein
VSNQSAMSASYQFSQLARDFHRMAPAIRRGLRTEFVRIGQPIVSDARSRAGAWSSRIPAAISSRGVIQAGQDRVGVEVRVSASVPHARPYEGISQQGSTSYFRHPVFGNRENWVSQKTRPYLWPAVLGRRDDANAAALSAVENAARECGFR